jgi:hypothetical protein
MAMADREPTAGTEQLPDARGVRSDVPGQEGDGRGWPYGVGTDDAPDGEQFGAADAPRSVAELIGRDLDEPSPSTSLENLLDGHHDPLFAEPPLEPRMRAVPAPDPLFGELPEEPVAAAAGAALPQRVPGERRPPRGAEDPRSISSPLPRRCRPRVPGPPTPRTTRVSTPRPTTAARHLPSTTSCSVAGPAQVRDIAPIAARSRPPHAVSRPVKGFPERTAPGARSPRTAARSPPPATTAVRHPMPMHAHRSAVLLPADRTGSATTPRTR